MGRDGKVCSFFFFFFYKTQLARCPITQAERSAIEWRVHQTVFRSIFLPAAAVSGTCDRLLSLFSSHHVGDIHFNFRPFHLFFFEES